MADLKTITVIGLGYVGLPTAALLARAGYVVRGVDIDERIIETLSSGVSPLGEAEIAAIIVEALGSGQLTVSADVQPADAFIVCVPTPTNTNKSADLSMVRAAVDAMAPVVRKGALIILESTSPIGTTRNVVAGRLKDVGLDPEKDVDVCYCPERVFPGASVHEILNNDRVVGGLTQQAAQRAKTLYESFCEGAAVTTSAEAAEYSKLVENTFRDVNIALANVFARIAEDLHVDIQEVITLANRHPRVNVHKPGPGVGGHCIPVDPWFLIHSAPDASELLRTARDVNDGQAARLIDRAEREGLESGGKVAILGAAYRGDLDDARESPSATLIDVLKARGYSWSLHDPFVSEMPLHGGEVVAPESVLADAVGGADALVVMTDHSVYRALSPDKFETMNGRLIIDGRQVLHQRAMSEAGFTVVPIGAPVRPAQAPQATTDAETRGGAPAVVEISAHRTGQGRVRR